MQACHLARPPTPPGRTIINGWPVSSRAAPANKKPGPSGPGLFELSCFRSGGRLEQLVGVGLDRLDGLRGDLLRQLGELLAPASKSLELPLCVAGPQLKRLGRRLHSNEFLREVERSAGVGLEDFHQLGGILAGALAGAGEYGFHRRVVALGDVLEAGVVVASLRNALLGESANLLGNLERDDRGREGIG